MTNRRFPKDYVMALADFRQQQRTGIVQAAKAFCPTPEAQALIEDALREWTNATHRRRRYTIEEVMELLDVARNTLYRWEQDKLFTIQRPPAKAGVGWDAIYITGAELARACRWKLPRV